MRFHLVAIAMITVCAAPALAQRSVPVEKRVERLEQELRAVQRKVFPAGNVEPEIRQEPVTSDPSGVPAGAPVAELSERLDSLEKQLASLTGQIEQNGFRMRQMEEAMARFQADAEARLAQIEGARPVQQSASSGGSPTPAAEAKEEEEQEIAAASPPAASTSLKDPAEEAYNAGFRLWEQKRYGEAQAALEAVAKQYPRHARASWARNLAGRAYLDDGKPATAAKILLNNYQTNPKGERAPDSLLYLGEALTRLGKTAEACQVYGELQDVYGPTLRAPIRQQLPKARASAKCTG